VFVHVPEDQHAEAFGLVYIESLMAGVPCVFTRSGIMHDLDTASLSGVRTVPFKDRQAIAREVTAWLAQAPDQAQRAAFASHNTAYLSKVVDIRLKMKAINALYDSM
jgi:glycosyltransferase involved in cell wall biosynthesis